MAWYDFVFDYVKKIPMEIMIALIFLSAIFIYTFINQDLHKGFGDDETDDISNIHTPFHTNTVQTGVVQTGTPNSMNNMNNIQPSNINQGIQNPSIDTSVQAIQQAHIFMKRMYDSNNPVYALQLADTAAAYLTMAARQRPDLAPQLNGSLNQVQQQRINLSNQIQRLTM